MRVEINEILFHKMMESVAHCVQKNSSRESFRFIRLLISDFSLTAYSCDGYRAAKTTIPISTDSDDVNWDCCIKPIKTKPSKSGQNPVIIEQNDGVVSVEITTEYGKAKYFFEQPKEKIVDVEKVYITAAQSLDRKIGMNPQYVKSALTALSKVGNSNKCVVFECQENAKGAFFIKSNDGICYSEQLVLPIRINEWSSR